MFRFYEGKYMKSVVSIVGQICCTFNVNVVHLSVW